MMGLIAIAGIQASSQLREARRRRPKSRSRRADALLIISPCRSSGVLPSLETIEISGGPRHDGPQSLKPPEPVEPASWACMVAGLVQIWGDALKLQDFTAFGKLRPWEVRREQTIGVAAAYCELAGRSEGKEFARIGGLMERCGTALEFACATLFETEDQVRRLVTANFCRGRLCPMCNWRRSQKIGAELEQVVKVYQDRNPKSAMVMLTLTERNVAAADLGETISQMSKAFSRLRKRVEWQRAVRASFRSVEVTCPQPGEFHPHTHILLFVDEDYVAKSHDLYVPQAEWSRLWRECRGLDYRPVVDVRRMKRVSEVAKYVTKSADYLTTDEDGWSADPDTIEALHVALKSRRLIAWSRELGLIRKELGCSDDDMEDGNTGFPPDYVVVFREVYRWNPVTPKRGFYHRVKILPPKDDEVADVDEHETG
jgi:plasmid rolling circle replication initiator protein Rep